MNYTSVDVRREFLDKKECLAEARRLLREGNVRNMSEKQLAGEIYFHALAFFFCDRTGLLPYVRSHAHPIDLRDGGDMLHRRAVYAAVWKLAGLRLRRKNR